MLALELQGLAHVDIGHFVAGFVNFCQGFLGLFDVAGLQLGEFEAALTVELVLDDVFSSSDHGRSCQLSLELVRRTMRIL